MAIDMENLDVVTDPIPLVIDFNDDTTYEEAEAMALDKSITLASESANYFFALYKETVQERKSMQIRTEAASGFIAAGKAFLTKVIKKIISLLKSLVRLVFKNAFKEYRGGGGGGGGVSSPQEINHKIDIFVKNELDKNTIEKISKFLPESVTKNNDIKKIYEDLQKEKDTKAENLLRKIKSSGTSVSREYEKFFSKVIDDYPEKLFDAGIGRFKGKGTLQEINKFIAYLENGVNDKKILEEIKLFDNDKLSKFKNELNKHPKLTLPWNSTNKIDLYKSINTTIDSLNKYNSTANNTLNRSYFTQKLFYTEDISLHVEWITAERVKYELSNKSASDSLATLFINIMSGDAKAQSLYTLVGFDTKDILDLEKNTVVLDAIEKGLATKEEAIKHTTSTAGLTADAVELVLLYYKLVFDQYLLIISVMREVMKSVELVTLRAAVMFKEALRHVFNTLVNPTNTKV